MNHCIYLFNKISQKEPKGFLLLSLKLWLGLGSGSALTIMLMEV